MSHTETNTSPDQVRLGPLRNASLRLGPLNLGNVELDFPVVQAALSGYSDGPMRRVARKLGASYTLCEVMLDKFLVEVRDRPKNRRFLAISEEEHPVGGQLMGADPEQFGPAALRLVEAGFDVIDINFGCPVKKVVGRCRGGYHLSQPSVALEIVSRVRDVVPEDVPVTVKMRRGIDDSEQSRDKFFGVLGGAFQLGVAAITGHGRSVEQRYDGPSRWEFLRDVKQHAGERIILGSGDLFTAQACLDMMRITGVDGVTVARGAIGHPWIFQQARALSRGEPLPDPPGLFEQREVIAEHYSLAEALYGADRCVAPMRKFGIKYARLHPHSVAVRDAFVRVSEPGEWREVLDKWYAEDLPGVRPEVEESNPLASDCEFLS